MREPQNATPFRNPRASTYLRFEGGRAGNQGSWSLPSDLHAFGAFVPLVIDLFCPVDLEAFAATDDPRRVAARLDGWQLVGEARSSEGQEVAGQSIHDVVSRERLNTW